MAKHQIVGNVSATVEDIIRLLAGTSKDHLLRTYYEKYKEMGYMQDSKDEDAFLTEMSIVKHILDWPTVRLFASAKQSGKPLRRQIIKAVRFQGQDGKEHIRFAARFIGEDKHGKSVQQTVGGVGVWEEPVFDRVYDKELEDYRASLDVANTIQHCEYDWPASLKELSKDFTPDIMFYFIEGDKKWRIHDRQDWEKMSREELADRERSKDDQETNKILGKLVETLKKGA